MSLISYTNNLYINEENTLKKTSTELIQFYIQKYKNKNKIMRKKIFPMPTEHQIITRELRQTANRIIQHKRYEQINKQKQKNYLKNLDE